MTVNKRKIQHLVGLWCLLLVKVLEMLCNKISTVSCSWLLALFHTHTCQGGLKWAWHCKQNNWILLCPSFIPNCINSTPTWLEIRQMRRFRICTAKIKFWLMECILFNVNDLIFFPMLYLWVKCLINDNRKIPGSLEVLDLKLITSCGNLLLSFTACDSHRVFIGIRPQIETTWGWWWPYREHDYQSSQPGQPRAGWS